mmetsp:Transcript_37610/g.75250  ORF Transcript_37610/g.75250 Transcript_37610/m.75250 type:complete len:206 (+) Transcript_37610:579-1196(+)
MFPSNGESPSSGALRPSYPPAPVAADTPDAGPNSSSSAAPDTMALQPGLDGDEDAFFIIEHRYFWRWDLMLAFVRSSTFISLRIVFGFAWSKPRALTAASKRACRSAVQTKRRFPVADGSSTWAVTVGFIPTPSMPSMPGGPGEMPPPMEPAPPMPPMPGRPLNPIEFSTPADAPAKCSIESEERASSPTPAKPANPLERDVCSA